MEGLAIDWSSNILYWTDSLMKMVELSQVDGKHRKVLFKLEGDTEPRGIIADPVNGYTILHFLKTRLHSFIHEWFIYYSLIK